MLLNKNLKQLNLENLNTGLKQIKQSEMSLSKRLVAYMLLMFIVIVIVVIIGSLAFGKFPLAQKELKETLEMQMLSFEKDVSYNMESLASNGFLLSKALSSSIDSYLDSKGKTLPEVVASDTISLCNSLYDPLYEYMIQSNCTGAFFILDSTNVDGDAISKPTSDNDSRAGIYINNFNNSSDRHNTLLFRGNPSLADAHQINLHRKWQKDFSIDKIPNYEEILSLPTNELENFYQFSEPTVLTGTYDKVILLILPILGPDQDVYGLCGFEISSLYFKNRLSQPTTLEYLSCTLSVFKDNELQTHSGFSTGILDGNYTPIYDNFKLSDLSDSLIRFKGASSTLRGLTKPIKFSEQSPEMALTVAVPEAYYDSLVLNSRITTIALLGLLVFFAVICSLILTRRFMNPISDAFLFLKNKNSDSKLNRDSRLNEDGKRYNIKDLDDLIEHISTSEDAFNKQYSELMAKQEESERNLLEVEEQLKLLAAEKVDSISTADYERFKNNIEKLTPKESEILSLYARRLTTEEVLRTQGFSKNTLKYHNSNIYSKLGVSGKKELLQYIVVLNYSDKQ